MNKKNKQRIPIPENKPGQRIIIYSGKYVYLVTKARWDNTTKNSKDDRKLIGSVDENDPTMMYPNTYYIQNYSTQYPEQHVLVHNNNVAGGVFICVLRAAQKIGVLTAIQDAFPDQWPRIIATCVYWIDSQDSVSQLFSYWFFDNFCGIYTAMDSSAFTNLFHELDKNGYQMEQYRSIFKKEYDKAFPIDQCTPKKRLVGCDATNVNVTDSDNEYAGYGHAKEDNDKPIAAVMSYCDERTGITLLWDYYPGSVLDKSQIEYTLAKSIELGFENLHLFFDRGFITKGLVNLFHSLKKEYGIVFSAMVPSTFGFVSKVIQTFRSTLCNNQKYYISEEQIFGMKIPKDYIKNNFSDFSENGSPIIDLFLYYDDNRASDERQNFNDYISAIKKGLEQRIEYTENLAKDAGKYLIVLPIPSGKRKFTIVRNEAAIQEVQDLKGYFIIASNADDSQDKEIVYARKRDKNEKAYRRRKSFFGLTTPGTATNETYCGKMNITDIAQNIEEAIEYYGKPFTSSKTSETVSTMIAELHKIKFHIDVDGKIRLAYPLTKMQKDILNLFDLSEDDVISYTRTLEWGKPFTRIFNAKEKKEIHKAEIKAHKTQKTTERKAKNAKLKNNKENVK